MTAPLECRGLVKRYGPVLALDGVDLAVEPGSVKGFLGPNGAGKTTLLRIVVGLLHADDGSASLFGVPVEDPGARRRVGYLPADPVFYDALSGRRNLDLLATVRGAVPVDRAWAAATIGLDEADLDRPVGTYSSGMRQKLGIVQAVQHRPDLLVLDEPANRLDPLAHRGFEEIVRHVAAEGRAVLLSSHTLPEVEALCDSLAMIHRGRILVDAPTEDLTGHVPRRVTIRYARPPTSPPPELSDAMVEGTRVRGRIAAGRLDVLRRLVDDAGVVDLLVEPAGLEDVFYALYEHGVAALPEVAR